MEAPCGLLNKKLILRWFAPVWSPKKLWNRDIYFFFFCWLGEEGDLVIGIKYCLGKWEGIDMKSIQISKRWTDSQASLCYQCNLQGGTLVLEAFDNIVQWRLEKNSQKTLLSNVLSHHSKMWLSPAICATITLSSHCSGNTKPLALAPHKEQPFLSDLVQ